MKRRWSLLILLCLLLTGCSAEASGGQLISAAEGSGAYSEALLPFLPGYALRDGEDTLYAEVSRGNAVACFDVQAIPAMDRGVGRYWYPHVSATVVLAVDRTRTDAVITGWNSLRESRVPVGMSSFSVVRNMLAIGAMSYGLNPKEPTKGDALDFLEQLCQNGGFELDGSDAPILICLDYEAAAWNRSGGTYEIIVPVEGTLTYRMGLLSDTPLTLEPGLYVSRKDRMGAETVTTFDLRMTAPNREPVMNTAEIHTIEHLGATYLRNDPDWKDRTVYFGPMGCQTGFYFLFDSRKLTDTEAVDLVKEVFAAGALKAARYLAGRDAPGLYGMRDLTNSLLEAQS